MEYMKTFTIFGLLFLLSSQCYSQAPQGMNYQAFIRDNQGNMMVNQSISVLINIHSDNANGTTVYSESHNPTTNQYGMVNLVIGQGNVVNGQFNNINWGGAAHFAEIMIDPAGGANYQPLSNQQLMSVPYALYAETSGDGPPGPVGPAGPPGPAGNCQTIGNGNLMAVYTPTQAYGFSQNQGTGLDYDPGVWTSQTLSGTVMGAESSENQLVIYTSSNAYGFSQNQGADLDYDVGVWTSVPLSGTVLGAVASKLCVVVYTTTNAYGFSQNQGSDLDNDVGVWTSVPISGTFIGTAVTSRNIMIYTTTNAYGFSQNQGIDLDNDVGVWTSVPMTGSPQGSVSTK